VKIGGVILGVKMGVLRLTIGVGKREKNVKKLKKKLQNDKEKRKKRKK